jgi:hypothetical protein
MSSPSVASSPPVPPVGVVRLVEGLRARLLGLARKLVPAPVTVLELAQGSMVTQALYAAAELGLADELAAGPLTAAELGGRVGADPDAVHRLLRLLACYSLFAQDRDGRYRLTRTGRALTSDHPASMRPLARLMGHPLHWEDWSGLLEAVRTGEPSLPKLRGMGAFEFLAANPEYGQVFMQGMGAMSAMETAPVLAAADFARFRTIVDVGGGAGTLLAGALRRAPEARGILFDSRAGEMGAGEVLAGAGVADRCAIEAGGLFDPPPPGADAYILKHIVHDWPEAEVLAMLRGVRGAVADDGRLLLMEFVVPPDGTPHPAKLVDLWLMLLVGGRERTRTQYRDLLAEAGFRLDRVVPTVAGLAIVEAVPC